MQAIQKGIKTNQKYHEADQYAKKIEGVSRNTTWFETKTKYEGQRRLLDAQKSASLESSYGRREITLRRAARLQALYEREYSGWEGELRKCGLSIYKNKS